MVPALKATAHGTILTCGPDGSGCPIILPEQPGFIAKPPGIDGPVWSFENNGEAQPGRHLKSGVIAIPCKPETFGEFVLRLFMPLGNTERKSHTLKAAGFRHPADITGYFQLLPFK